MEGYRKDACIEGTRHADTKRYLIRPLARRCLLPLQDKRLVMRVVSGVLILESPLEMTSFNSADSSIIAHSEPFTEDGHALANSMSSSSPFW